MLYVIKLSRRHGIEVYTANAIDKTTRTIMTTATFFSERAARMWCLQQSRQPVTR